jgi:hypothetical protein
MCIPEVGARMKEGDQPTGARIASSSVRLFVVVAPEATVAEIIKVIGTALGFRDDMVYCKFMSGVVHE